MRSRGIWQEAASLCIIAVAKVGSRLLRDIRKK